MKIAIYQGPGASADDDAVTANLATIAARAAQAADDGAHLLIVPEMFVTGYNIGPAAVADHAEPVDGRIANHIASLAQHHDIAILYGYPERSGDAIYNAAQLFDHLGTARLNYRKTHLFGDLDRQAFSAGCDDSVIVELGGMRLGVLICYDVEFPENVRKLALAGADLVAVPTALMSPYTFIARSLINARAYENQVFLAYANRCASEAELNYLGQSCIVGPDGIDLARAGEDESLISANLDQALLESSRRLNTYLDDRRPNLYRALSRNDVPEIISA